MKSMNIISRCQAIYRAQRLDSDLCACHHSLVLAICRAPGRSQDELAKDICLNKSTVTRALAQLEERGYVTRTPDASDKRRTLVEPTGKMLDILPEVRAITAEWNSAISADIPADELAVFQSVLKKMEQNARNIIQKAEDNAEK
ncbi:MAG: MarR family transcriptional regulator [Oscillospiraceae bacterium]|nr:MarR family transcriptional regulator [Oscillospiraceae bacterium]